MTAADLAQTWLPIAGAVVAAVGVIWRLAVLHSTVQDAIAIIGKLTDRSSKLAETVILLQQMLAVRERDQARLEGKIELLTATLTTTAGELRQVVGSTDALWKVVGQIAPDQVRIRRG